MSLIITYKTMFSGLRDNIGLKGFGRSLGTGVDMDFNGYKDILVGAYLSNQVTLLRTRPVININSTLEVKSVFLSEYFFKYEKYLRSLISLFSIITW